jgi:outer membrane lipoprotein-sorting protein
MLVLWAVLLGGGAAGAADEMPTQYSADMDIQTMGQTMTVKVSMDQGKARSEMELPEAIRSLGAPSMVTIARPDKGKVYMVYPDSKTFEEQPLRPEDAQVSAISAPSAATEAAGEELMNGVPSKKYKVSYGGQTMWAWVSAATGIPVKMQTLDGATVINFRNVRLGPQPASLFEIPAGYEQGQGMAGLAEAIQRISPGSVTPHGAGAPEAGRPVTPEEGAAMTEQMINQMPPELAEQMREAMKQLPPPQPDQPSQ